MKVQILQENLNKGITIAGRSVSSKAQLPILSNLLLKTDQNRLQISATNLETGVILWLGAKVEEEGEITVPAKVLGEIITSLPSGTVELKTENNSLQISIGGYRASLNCVPSLEFPKLPTPGSQSLVSFSSEKLVEGIDQVAFAAATDEGRPVLTGVLLEVKGKSLSLVATDGYRLSLKTVELDSSVKETVTLILPAKALTEVSRIINDEKMEKGQIIQVGYTLEKNQIVFVFPQLQLFSRLIEGDFPDYKKIVPESFVTKTIIETEEFTRGVKLVSVFARDSSNIVKFKIKDGLFEMSANSPQVGDNKISLEAKTEGDGGEVAFNYRFLQSFLGVIKEKEVSLEFNGPLNPGMFKIVEDTSFIHVIMPVRLQEE